MPKKPPTAEPEQSLVLDVLNTFLDRLEKDPSMGPDVATRLRTTILEMHDSSADALLRALFPDETLP